MFSYPKEKMSTVLRIIASEYGYFHTTRWYQQKLLEVTGRSCSRQWICGVLGNASERLRFGSRELVDASKKLLHLCGGDLKLAKKLVDYAATSK